MYSWHVLYSIYIQTLREFAGSHLVCQSSHQSSLFHLRGRMWQQFYFWPASKVKDPSGKWLSTLEIWGVEWYGQLWAFVSAFGLSAFCGNGWPRRWRHGLGSRVLARQYCLRTQFPWLCSRLFGRRGIDKFLKGLRTGFIDWREACGLLCRCSAFLQFFRVGVVSLVFLIRKIIFLFLLISIYNIWLGLYIKRWNNKIY